MGGVGHPPLAGAGGGALLLSQTHQPSPVRLQTVQALLHRAQVRPKSIHPEGFQLGLGPCYRTDVREDYLSAYFR
jgi:hypothetical protein